MILCGSPQLHKLLSKSVEQRHAGFISHMCNDIDFVKVTLAEHCHFHSIVQVYIILHHLVPADLQNVFMFSENVTGYVGGNSLSAYSFQECRPLIDKKCVL